MTELFSDLDFSMKTHPVTKDILRITGDAAIKRSAKNLLMTNYFEVFFNSAKGSPIRDLLFENITPITSITVQRAVMYQLAQYEPRMVVVSVEILDEPENHLVNITIKYYTIDNKTIEVFDFPMKRTR